MALPRIQHVNLIVSDLAAARDFYVREFGFSERKVEGLDYPGAFLVINEGQELHLAQLPSDAPAFRSHFCLRVADFSAVFHRMKALGVLDSEPWGRIRELPDRSLQMYVRDPSGNLVEITSEPEDRDGIDPAIFTDKAYGGEPYRYYPANIAKT
ncbi:VOC family protein [Lewinella sp. IMCC34183]|uniref:VOC family protein n=1 Tax=Lewinella sp. IMCC34183 TaxID=2248762 RepID=UPI000E2413F4|nr:VOC family protein [Lewinella sp. IMCC34183]